MEEGGSGMKRKRGWGLSLGRSEVLGLRMHSRKRQAIPLRSG